MLAVGVRASSDLATPDGPPVVAERIPVSAELADSVV